MKMLASPLVLHRLAARGGRLLMHGCAGVCLAIMPSLLNHKDIHAASTLATPEAQNWARAQSRFGYGPVGWAREKSGQSWAMSQLQQAQAASARALVLRPEHAALTLTLPQIFESHLAEQAAVHAAAQKGENRLDAPGFGALVARQTHRWRLEACSNPALENPLLARMTEFWFNHLNVYISKVGVRPFVGHYLTQVIRPHALGRYEDLLIASAQHPAMLLYLDQAFSVAPPKASAHTTASPHQKGINENYAREVLELYTLGFDSSTGKPEYSQKDVESLARMLTGWTVDATSHQGFRAVAAWHDFSPKTLLGHSFNSAQSSQDAQDMHAVQNAQSEGEQALRLLARHPATAKRIATRLAQWFVSENPKPALIARLTQRYLATQGDIAAVMQTLIEADDTWQDQAKIYKTPLDYACSVLAAQASSGRPLDEAQLDDTLAFLYSAGQPLLAWPTPDGYTALSQQWLNAQGLNQRTEFAFRMGLGVDMQLLEPWLSPLAQQQIQHLPKTLQSAVALASPPFMYK